MKTLNLEIVCGATTCASEPGKFCRFLSTQRFGTLYFCKIFSENNSIKGVQKMPLDEKDGWITRHVDCINSCSEN